MPSFWALSLFPSQCFQSYKRPSSYIAPNPWFSQGPFCLSPLAILNLSDTYLYRLAIWQGFLLYILGTPPHLPPPPKKRNIGTSFHSAV